MNEHAGERRKIGGAHAAITDGKKEFIVAYLDIGITKERKNDSRYHNDYSKHFEKPFRSFFLKTASNWIIEFTMIKCFA